jgi:hypothetical protein
LTALGRAPRLGSEAVFQRPQFWQAQVRAHPTVDLARELLRAEAWLEANPRRRIQRLPRFLGNWFANADGDEEDVD